MEITTALLCDYAQVREGLLFVASGGITRCYRDAFPAPLGLSVAVVVELDQIEAARLHEIHVVLIGEDGANLAEVRGAFQVGPAHEGALEVGEKLAIPITLDLRLVAVPSAGPYDFGVYVDGEHRRTLSVWVKPTPPEMLAQRQGQPQPPPPAG